MSYTDRLQEVADQDVTTLKKKDREYCGSWLKRGGVGAFMMAARKWDRLENAMALKSLTGGLDPGPDRYDIIGRALADGREEGILDDIGDLRRYLLLVEAEVRRRLDPEGGQ